MDTWLIISSLALAIFLLLSLSLLARSSKKPKFPPAPATFPIIGPYLRLSTSFVTLEPLLRSLRSATKSPLLSIPFGPRQVIIVASRSAAHQALIHHGSSFSSRPPPLTPRISISSSLYSPTWRFLRRNMIQLLLRPQTFSAARRQVLRSLLSSLRGGNPVTLMPHLQFAMFSLLATMCFGEELTESQIKQIEKAQRDLLLNFRRFNILFIFPKLTKIFLPNKWKDLRRLRDNQESALLPIITARTEFLKQRRQNQENPETGFTAYVDTLLDLELPEKGRKLNENEILSLSGEFHDAGTDTTSTGIQWIMANLVKYPKIQEKLYKEIKGVVGQKAEVDEEDLSKMNFLKAIILEGLRRHPPAHFVLPHATTDDMKLEGYDIPKGTIFNVMVADMGWDHEVWEDPMEFKPERFLSDNVAEFDLTGSKEIKMMPFGVGRRICPGLNLAMLHLEYFVANLVWAFEWKVPEGEEVDLAEKQEFTTVMKNPLRVCLSPRG